MSRAQIFPTVYHPRFPGWMNPSSEHKTSANTFWHLCAHPCWQQLRLCGLAGTSAAFGRQEAFQSRESRLKPTVTRITQIL